VKRNGREFCRTLRVTVPAAAWAPPGDQPPSLKLPRSADFQGGQGHASRFGGFPFFEL